MLMLLYISPFAFLLFICQVVIKMWRRMMVMPAWPLAMENGNGCRMGMMATAPCDGDRSGQHRIAGAVEKK